MPVTVGQMVYCSKCGVQNEDDAKFCKGCSSSLTGGRSMEKEWENGCDRECSGSGARHVWLNIWIVIFALVAVGIILSIFMRIFNPMMPDWIGSFQYWDILGLLVALAVVIMIVSAMVRARGR